MSIAILEVEFTAWRTSGLPVSELKVARAPVALDNRGLSDQRDPEAVLPGVQCFSRPMRFPFSNTELPMTDSELLVMAITPIMGCNRPMAAIGMAATL